MIKRFVITHRAHKERVRNLKRGITMRNLLSLFLGLLVATAFVAGPGSANAKEYLLTTTKPNSLVLIDAAARKVVRTLEMPGDGAPMSVVASPDGNTAYVLTNRLGSIVGIDLDSGATTFKAEFSTEIGRASCRERV